MNNKKIIWYYPVLFFGIFFFLTGSCKKDDDSENPVGQTTALFNSSLTYGTMTDQDGNTYKTITIGTQTWMAENLRATTYRNGDTIEIVANNDAWTALTSGASCTGYHTQNLDTIATFGRYYNWYAVTDTRNIAPVGWHVPTDAEWFALITYLGGENTAGGKLKEINSVHWLNPNTGATNSSGFTGLPGSFRGGIFGVFYPLGGNAYWWSKSEATVDEAYSVYTDYATAKAILGYSLKNDGFAVRCVMD